MEENIFESSSVSNVYFKMAVPVVLGLVISIIYNITDTFFIAKTGNTNLVAGVSLCAPIFTLLMAFGNIFGQGGSSLISRLFGKNDTENLHKVSSFCFYFAILIGVISGAILFVFKTPILHILGATETTISYASSYYIWFALGAPLIVLSFIHSNLLRAEGMSTESMISTAGGSIVNLILDPILIFNLNLGASGAAIATVLGYVFTDVFCLIIVFSKSKALSIDIKKTNISSDFVGQIFGVGTSAALSNIMSSICLILINQNLLQYGDDKIALMGIVQKISLIVMLIITGFSFGGAPVIGYYYGSNNQSKLKELLSFVIKFLCGTALILSLILITIAPIAISIFLKDAELITAGAFMLRTQVISMFLMAVVLFGTIIFQATGKSGPALILSISRQGFVFVIALVLMSKFLGYNGILWTQAVSDLLSAVLAVCLLKITFGSTLFAKNEEE